MSETQLITFYFTLGLSNDEILAFLKVQHNCNISLRTLKRRLKNLKLFRKKGYSPINQVATYLFKDTVRQETIRRLLKSIDPVGVEIRTRRRLRRRQYNNKGPNYLWHVDSYDKLKPFGIGINGCIDGFSRHIMWMKAGRTNNNPRVIGGYFVDTIQKIGGIPLTIRADMGTENRHIEQMQVFFRRDTGINIHRPAFLYGKSTANQKIECWWGILRKHNAEFWMNLFKKIQDDGYFNGSYLEKALIQFCFLRIIQSELNSVVLEWNSHNISSSKNSILPRGKPLIMYHIPEIYRSNDYLISVEFDDLEIAREECVFLDQECPCDKDVFELCNILLNEAAVENIPSDPYNAIDVYLYLRNKLSCLL
ncbi:hypothetical protein PPYR_04107 [Photinus pyralis]|uniref:Integrase core domain-containing protein n=1 Tax=Photinus pyralis TaxID=7054 RepID=A0A5N4AU66_PHOPY|nr:hypothetical protein PPYR_06542 [Photinus pyralis]KAB0801921.1 hypothetical protein PPYR_04107 [Photinus pyralis]